MPTPLVWSRVNTSWGRFRITIVWRKSARPSGSWYYLDMVQHDLTICILELYYHYIMSPKCGPTHGRICAEQQLPGLLDCDL